MASNTIPGPPSVFDALSSAGTLNALAYPSPYPAGLAGLVFDWTGEEKLELRTDATDAWIETNTTVNDQAALGPPRFTLNASTAEIVLAPATAVSAPPQPANPFPVNDAISPELTPGAEEAAAANSAPTAPASQATSNLYQYYSGLQSNTASRQAAVVGFIYQLWLGRVLFTIETPWGIFDSMIIESADAVQPEETAFRTDHKITFKKFNIVQDGALNPDQLLGRAYNQANEALPNLNGNIGQSTVSDQQQQQMIGNWAAASQPFTTPTI